jgi:hypothetical protein
MKFNKHTINNKITKVQDGTSFNINMASCKEGILKTANMFYDGNIFNDLCHCLPSPDGRHVKLSVSGDTVTVFNWSL